MHQKNRKEEHTTTVKGFKLKRFVRFLMNCMNQSVVHQNRVLNLPLAPSAKVSSTVLHGKRTRHASRSGEMMLANFADYCSGSDGDVTAIIGALLNFVLSNWDQFNVFDSPLFVKLLNELHPVYDSHSPDRNGVIARMFTDYFMNFQGQVEDIMWN